MKKTGIYQIVRDDEHKFALPNFFTLLRLVCLPFIIHFLRLDTRAGDIYALVFIMLAAFTDYLDGHYARKLQKTSNVGRMMDPLIDKISIAAAMLVLAAHRGLPYWYVFLVIGRDFFLLIGSAVVVSKKRLIVESNKVGKWTSTLFAAVIIVYTLNIPYLKQALMYVTLFLIPVSLFQYIRKHKNSIKFKNRTENLEKNHSA
jgi:CDP-diacylglycerol--glycerol-3-phosphate 3-phosphatidyltransferase